MQLDLDPFISESTDLGRLWQRLLDGNLFVSDTRCEQGRCYAVIERARHRRPRQMGVRILERFFEGESQKLLACELGLAVATVSCHSMRALRAVARQHHVSRAPIVLIMAALAAGGLLLEPARFEGQQGPERWLISVEVPGQSLRARLSDSEWSVARRAIEGETHAEIALGRGTSVRTIANQLAAVFEKLGASGRGELRALAVRASSETSQRSIAA